MFSVKELVKTLRFFLYSPQVGFPSVQLYQADPDLTSKHIYTLTSETEND